MKSFKNPTIVYNKEHTKTHFKPHIGHCERSKVDILHSSWKRNAEFVFLCEIRKLAFEIARRFLIEILTTPLAPLTLLHSRMEQRGSNDFKRDEAEAARAYHAI